MSSGSNLDGSSVEKPKKKRWWPRERLAQFFFVISLALCVPFIVEHAFQFLRSRQFLRLAEKAAAYEPYAYFLGSILAVSFTWGLWKSRGFEHNEGKFESKFGQGKFVLILLFTPGMAFFSGWLIVTLWVPLVLHQFATKTQVEVPFKIKGFEFGRSCRGVRAVHPRFYDDKLCGVQRRGHSTEWEGRTIVVIGKQSSYGLSMERYRFEEASFVQPSDAASTPAPALPADRMAEINRVFASCVKAPHDIPRPLEVLFKIVIGAKGDAPSVKIASLRSPSSPTYQLAAESIAARLQACPSLGGVPPGNYSLPVVVGR
ncbi:hypothetical protein [Aureimonas flava]|uniref:hypothetical protein n=1 Tax=Aureimonas flava TaxID=2320271 RepID=UPI0010A95F57|nr:hypothetical protein [Aureimonas flava]